MQRKIYFNPTGRRANQGNPVGHHCKSSVRDDLNCNNFQNSITAAIMISFIMAFVDNYIHKQTDIIILLTINIVLILMIIMTSMVMMTVVEQCAVKWVIKPSELNALPHPFHSWRLNYRDEDYYHQLRQELFKLGCANVVLVRFPKPIMRATVDPAPTFPIFT